MATAQLDTLLRHLHQLAVGRCPQQGTDRQLLEDFSARGDEAAFATLIARHGPMVLRVCRRVLHHEQDAEDAFQAAFLVLAQTTGTIRRPEALAAWLHGVAYRTAMKVKRSAARRRHHEARWRNLPPRAAAGPTWDEVQAVLDEEIQRLPEAYRSAFVLCVLEGKSGAEAAAALGIKEATVSSRLARARQRLRQQLARRGIKLAALLAALSVVEHAGQAAVPGALAHATVRSGLLVAAGKPAAAVIPAHVAALAAGVTRAMLFTKVKIATIILLAVGALIAGTGVLTRRALAERQAETKPDTTPEPRAKGQEPPTTKAADKPRPGSASTKASAAVNVSGRVLSPDGAPLAGAKIYLTSASTKEQDHPVRATSDPAGQFAFTFQRSELDLSSPDNTWFQVLAVAEGYGPDWTFVAKPAAGTNLTLRLVKDLPMVGRILDLNGKPVKSATLRLKQIYAYTDTEAFLQTVRDRKWPLVDNKFWTGPFPGQPPVLTTATDGRFRLTGLGRDRLVEFELEGPGIAYGPVRALARELKAPVEPRPTKYPEGGPVLQTVYGATFDLLAVPSRLVRGVVRDQKTGRPVAGVGISAWSSTEHTQSDQEGRFEMRGLAKSDGGYGLSVVPAQQLYFRRSATFPDTPGLDPIQGDIELVGGVLAKGRVTHQVTGQPIAGARVFYDPLLPNPYVRYFGPNGAGVSPCSWTQTGPDGSYSLVVLPGPGALGFSASSPKETFMPALVTRQELKEFFKDNADHGNEDTLRIQAGVNSFSAVGQSQYNHLLLLNPREKDESLTRDVALRPARPLPGKVVGPDGKPLAGVTVYNPAPGWSSQRLAEDTFTVQGLHPRRTRHLVFLTKDRRLGAFVTLKGEVKEPLIVQLKPCGSVAGRLLDEDGQPVAGKTVRLDVDNPYGSEPPDVKTDRAGRFRIEGLVPGQRYQARLGPGRFGQYLFAPFAVKAGEGKTLGDAKIKPSLTSD